MRLLVTRPQPQADATSTRLRRLGVEALLSPLLATVALRWEPPALPPQALLFTSMTALRLGGARLATLHAVPVFAVGGATAAAASVHGFVDVRTAHGDASAALALAAAHGVTRLLHLAGEDRSVAHSPAGLAVEVREVYAARRVTALSDAAIAALRARDIDHVLLYSARSAAHFAALVDGAGLARAAINLAALSPAVLGAAGGGWGGGVAAATPDEDALFAAIGLVCEKA